jgi:hypothetical protein
MENEIRDIADLLRKGLGLLFIGAGVSVEAGLPAWPVAMEMLAEHISQRDASLAQVMRDRIKSGKFLEAAEFYNLADTDESFKIYGLETVFGKEPKITDRLRSLIRLIPSSFVTTNYDLVIENTWSDVYGKNILSLRNISEEFVTAHRSLNTGKQFVIHIHGSMEAPRDIVFSKSHFDDLLKIDEYFHFLRHVFMTKSIIFIGLSFRDPALRRFLDYAGEKLSLICERPSFAIIERNEVDLAQVLEKARVIPILYDKGKNHEELWNLILEVRKEVVKTEAVPLVGGPGEEEIKKLRANLAAVYAHYRIKSKHKSAADSIYAGIIRSIGWRQQCEKGEVTAMELANSLRQLLHIEIGKAQSMISSSIPSLVRMGLLTQNGDLLLFQKTDDSISEDLDRIILSIKDRANVRYSAKIMLEDEKIREFLLVSLVSDGVRLAHSILSNAG